MWKPPRLSWKAQLGIETPPVAPNTAGAYTLAQVLLVSLRFRRKDVCWTISGFQQSWLNSSPTHHDSSESWCLGVDMLQPGDDEHPGEYLRRFSHLT